MLYTLFPYLFLRGTTSPSLWLFIVVRQGLVYLACASLSDHYQRHVPPTIFPQPSKPEAIASKSSKVSGSCMTSSSCCLRFWCLDFVSSPESSSNRFFRRFLAGASEVTFSSANASKSASSPTPSSNPSSGTNRTAPVPSSGSSLSAASLSLAFLFSRFSFFLALAASLSARSAVCSRSCSAAKNLACWEDAGSRCLN